MYRLGGESQFGIQINPKLPVLHVVAAQSGRQIYGSIPVFTHTQGILYPPDTAPQGAPSLLSLLSAPPRVSA